MEQLNSEAKKLFSISEKSWGKLSLSELLSKDAVLLKWIQEMIRTETDHVIEHDRSTDAMICWWRVSVVRAGDHSLIVIADLSEMRSAEDRLRKNEQHQRQSQKLEAIGTLASGIAHDFNNILTGLIGNAQLMELDIEHPERLRGELAQVLAASERARTLVMQILTFSRKAEVHREAVNVAQLGAEVLRLVRAGAPSNIDIRHREGMGLPEIDADPTQVNQVVMNLCTNALHAMKGLGGVLELSEEVVLVDQDSLELHAILAKGSYVCVSVKDSGCGMSPVVLSRLYEPFFTTKAPGEGTGLGLSVVHGIMQQHKGAITVHSQPGKGSLFRLYFPVRAPGKETASPKPALSVVKGRGQRILFVDDEPVVLKTLGSMLDRLGYKVNAFGSPQEALASFAADPRGFDLVLSDLTMPGMSGLELAEKMIALRPGLVFILASGFIGETDMQRIRVLCIHHVLEKPISIGTLSRTLDAALND